MRNGDIAEPPGSEIRYTLSFEDVARAQLDSLRRHGPPPLRLIYWLFMVAQPLGALSIGLVAVARAGMPGRVVGVLLAGAAVVVLAVATVPKVRALWISLIIRGQVPPQVFHEEHVIRFSADDFVEHCPHDSLRVPWRGARVGVWRDTLLVSMADCGDIPVPARAFPNRAAFDAFAQIAMENAGPLPTTAEAGWPDGTVPVTVSALSRRPALTAGLIVSVLWPLLYGAIGGAALASLRLPGPGWALVIAAAVALFWLRALLSARVRPYAHALRPGPEPGYAVCDHEGLIQIVRPMLTVGLLPAHSSWEARDEAVIVRSVSGRDFKLIPRAGSAVADVLALAHEVFPAGPILTAAPPESSRPPSPPPPAPSPR